MKNLKHVLMGAAVSAVLAASQVGLAASNSMQAKMELTLDQIAETYHAVYAPADWKKKHWGWDLNTEVEKIREQIRSRDNVTLHEFHRMLRGLISSMRDYHVNIRFQWTEKATLPFLVRSAEGRYFIVHIDRNKLSPTAFPFNVGDEILTFGGRPIADVVHEIQAQTTPNTGPTDQAMSEMFLTSRAAARGDIVPRGTVDITGRTGANGAVKQTSVIWDYTPERISPELNPRDLSVRSTTQQPSFAEDQLEPFKNPKFALPFADDQRVMPQFGSNFDIGSRRSFLPPLGMKVWESSEESLFHAYIFRAGPRLIGYVRIAEYSVPDGAAYTAEFARLMTKMQYTTDALIIDQVNNPGGYLFYGNALISHLSDKVVPTPLNRVKMTQSDILDANDTLESLARIRNDEEAQRVMGTRTLTGYPVTYQVARSFGEYSRSLLADWNAGMSLSNPIFIGVDHIVPATEGVYTKPILFLVNELDFSCGDFVPAILQDATRKGLANVTVFGTRTAGAGGYILQNRFLNQMGIASFSVTGSIAERTEGALPIENLGVTPDVVYEMKAVDYERNFIGYVRAVYATLEQIIK